MTRSEKKSSRRKTVYGIGAAVVAVVAVAGAFAITGSGSASQNAAMNSLVHVVQRGPLIVSVSEPGTITAKEQAVVKSQVEGRATIIWLVPEGSQVKKGDLLVEMDSSGLQTDLVDQEIKVQNAEAEVIQAREALEVAKNQAAADIAQAELDAQFAKEDLRKYVEGEYPMEIKKLQAEITLAEEQHEQAAETLEWSERLFREKYISANELEKDRLAKNRAQLDWELAVADLNLMETYTYARQIAELESEVKQMDLALERTRRSARADVIKAETDLRAKESNFERETDKRNKIADQIAKCRITAPTDGMVVYAPQGNRWNREVLAAGMEIRERQELIYLPTASIMSAEVKVHESSLSKVKVGQPVRLRIDALPNQSFVGEVTNIAVMAEDGGWRNPDLKEYTTTIAIRGEAPQLRPGMTCNAEILIARYPDAVTVPLQSVIRVAGKPTVFVPTPEGPAPRPVEIGLDNNRMVRVTGGLNEGDRVLLSPPLEAGTRRSFDEDTDDDENAPASGEALAWNTVSGETVVGNPAPKAAELTPEQQQVVEGLKRAKEFGFLDRMELSESVRSDVDGILAKVESGESPEIKAETQQALTAAFNKARAQRRAQQGDDVAATQ